MGVAVSEARATRDGLVLALAWGVVAGVAVVLFVNANQDQAALFCFFVPLAVLALLGADRTQRNRSYGLGILLGTALSLPLIGLMVLLWAIWAGATAG